MKVKKILFVLLWISSLSLSAQVVVSVSNPIAQDTLLATIHKNSLNLKTVYVSGQAEFSSKCGYVRILLSDDYGYDLLVYESLPLVATNGIDNFSNVSMEAIDISSHLELTKIRVEIKNAKLKNLSVEISDTNISKTQQQQIRTDRIEQINSNLRARNALWRAGETSVSQMSYEEKKRLFGGKVPNLQGFEYYIGGIFELMEEDASSEQTTTRNPASLMTPEFDWRNRHGRNWTTPVRDQGYCECCYVFGAIGAVEGLVNLWYNQKIDLDLSEQQMVCEHGCNGGNPGGSEVLGDIRDAGVVDEASWPYMGSDGNSACIGYPVNVTENIQISGVRAFEYTTLNVDTLKKSIIQNGILSGDINSWEHVITLVGFGTVKVGDTIHYKAAGHNIYGYNIIENNDPRIGDLYWIFKNSWGTGWGNNGYAYVMLSIKDLKYTQIPLFPVIRYNHTDAEIICEDRDGDGYYYWGIGPKPDTCPCGVPDEPDGDDSDPNVGPMDEFGNCIPIADLVETITGSEIWNTSKTIYKPVVVESGSVLTINSYINCTERVSFTVQPGGKLVVDGGSLSTACLNKMWQGILVSGTSNQQQTAQYQGTVELKNNAVIEHALCAISTVDSTGGIIKVENATFRNNLQAIKYLPYERIGNGGIIADNVGKFTNCNFIIDPANRFSANGKSFQYHV